MEIILAIVVASAVILFGALISMGNERQRKAIDNLREQVILWAVQDLKIKRESLAREIKIEDPLDWLNRTITKVTGINYAIKTIEVFDTPQTLICTSGDGTQKIAFTPVSIHDVRRMTSGRKNRLIKLSSRNPLANMTSYTRAIEISPLNTDIFFDLELKLAWEALTGFNLIRTGIIWMYII
jgi:hypothetical protein